MKIALRDIKKKYYYEDIIENKKEINRELIKNKINNINSNNKKINNTNMKKIIYIKREYIFFQIIIIVLIQTIFKSYCKNVILSKDSMVTLKVSKIGTQKIFTAGTAPNKIYINDMQQSITNSFNYYLNPENIVKLEWTDEIDDCYNMFLDCNSIIEMNFSNFDATKCPQTYSMFRGCNSLQSIDLSGFITSNFLISMGNMFWDCYSLLSLNLSNIDTSNVRNFGHMLANCESLISLDISNFKTDNIKFIDNMFIGCKNLTSLNLSHFNLSNAELINNMFDGCESLKIIDFSNLDFNSVTNINNIDNLFLNCTNLEYINIKNLNSKINLPSEFFRGTPSNLMICIDDDNIELIKNILDNNQCIQISCDENLLSYENKYYTENGCLTKNCSLTNYKYEFENNCYEICPSNSRLRENIQELEGYNINANYFCKPICNATFPFEIISTQKCVENCDILNILNNSCILNYKLDEKKDNVKIYDTLLKKAEDIFTSEDYDTSEIEKGNNDVIKYNNMIITLTSTKNQKKEEKQGNMTTINLGDCENELKEAYNISYNETLYIKKIDVTEEGMMIPKIEFDIYYKLNGINLVKLNLSYCTNNKIDIFIPLKLTDNIDKFNSSSGYYNDICYITTSDTGTDMTLKDRKEEFINYNKTVCQENCFFQNMILHLI